MNNFFKLVYNELFKIYIRKSTWAMYIILAGIIIGVGFLSNIDELSSKQYSDDNWRETLEEENQELTKEMEEAGEDGIFYDMNSNIIAENNYYLENDIQPDGYGAMQFVLENQLLLSLVSLLTIIIAAGIVANEFRWGTIKLLLIRPITRTKALLSKYAAVILFAFFTLLFVLLFSYIIGLIFYGFGSFNPHMLVDDGNGLAYVSVLSEIVPAYGFKLVNLVMMATFAFAISTIFRNSALAIGVAIFLMMAANPIMLYFSDRAWAKFILFANTDLSQYTAGSTPFMEGMTLGFSITVLIVYYLLFMALSWAFFTIRDIAGQ
ncbi:ABC transporter permease [Oceanobacillus picturae]|uniref:ABC transporter permease n=1 Tax=Oceanobacillus picturae TaxID=171693 RepID=UPI000E6995CF|nr:ABC transporter permease [Oceanobacillus picturae]RIU89065.1 ABC transporter permease [Oceanobacillus picturae]